MEDASSEEEEEEEEEEEVEEREPEETHHITLINRKQMDWTSLTTTESE